MKTTIVCSLAFAILLLPGCAEESSYGSSPTQVELEAPREKDSLLAPPVERVADSSGPEPMLQAEVLANNYSNLLALSAEEAAWLDRHGYPTPAEMDALLTYDVDELSSATRNRKDPKSAALLGHRRLIEGDIDGAWAAFGVGANFGSLYAMQQLAIVSTQKATGLAVDELGRADQGNLGVMVAQLEVARMLGDHRAQALIDRYTENFDWDDYGQHVLTQTAIFMDQYGEYARATGARVVGPDPRPNAELWALLRTNPDAMVNVYTRGGANP